MDELEVIQQQIAELQKKAEVLEEVKSKIKAYGLTAKELGFGFYREEHRRQEKSPCSH